jgi:hypothetical protein
MNPGRTWTLLRACGWLFAAVALVGVVTLLVAGEANPIGILIILISGFAGWRLLTIRPPN